MEVYGHLAPALAVFVLVLFVIIDATFFGGFGLLMGWAARRSSGWALAVSPFLWVAMELARTYLITGFPWNLLGYAVQASGLRQLASLTGVYGLSALAMATSAMLAWLLLSSRTNRKTKRETRNLPAQAGAKLETGGEFRVANFEFRESKLRVPRGPSWSLAVWLILLLLAQWRLAPPPPVRGRELAFLVQPNVPLDEAALESWVPWRDPSQLQQLVQLSVSSVEQFLHTELMEPGGGSPVAAHPIQNPKSKIETPGMHPPLLIWAENPAPFFFTRDPVFRSAMENMARQAHAVVIGNTIVPVDATGNTITNSAFTLDPEGREVSRYDKIHLVPFGEYVPWWALPRWVNKITSEVGSFVPGSSYAVAPTPAGGIGVFICYEAIIPQLSRRLVAGGAGVLVNISNDAWYGNSAAAYQHLEMARLRTIENHRYLLRATNDGLTTLIDPYGRVLAEIPRYRRMVMPAYFDFETQQTFYSVHGDVFAWLSVAIAALMLAAAAVRPSG
jgi:apolipoprotein N-acyltransferase